MSPTKRYAKKQTKARARRRHSAQERRKRDPRQAHDRQALALARERGMRPLQAHGHDGLGIRYRQTNREVLARAALSTAIALSRVMDMTFWLPQAEAALAQVKGR